MTVGASLRIGYGQRAGMRVKGTHAPGNGSLMAFWNSTDGIPGLEIHRGSETGFAC